MPFVDDNSLKSNLPESIVDAMGTKGGNALPRIIAQINSLITRWTGIQPDDADDTTLADVQLYGAWMFEYLTAPWRGIPTDAMKELRTKYFDAKRELEAIHSHTDAAYPANAVTTTTTPRLGALL